MTSLLALISLIGTAFAGSGGEEGNNEEPVAEISEEEVQPAMVAVETVTTTVSSVPEWVSVLEALATEPLDENM
ncbi:MAG: hypothetical protein ABJJ69_01925, partial [Paracoccaceae bacterium]